MPTTWRRPADEKHSNTESKQDFGNNQDSIKEMGDKAAETDKESTAEKADNV